MRGKEILCEGMKRFTYRICRKCFRWSYLYLLIIGLMVAGISMNAGAAESGVTGLTKNSLVLYATQTEELSLQGAVPSKVSWSVSSTTYLSVKSTKTGAVVTAKKAGKAFVKAKYNQVEYLCEVVILPLNMTEKKMTVTVTETRMLNLTMDTVTIPGRVRVGSQSIVSDPQVITWYSSSTQGIELTPAPCGGVYVTGRKAGSYSVYGYYMGKKYTCGVTVKKRELPKGKLSVSKLPVRQGQEGKVTFAGIPEEYYGYLSCRLKNEKYASVRLEGNAIYVYGITPGSTTLYVDYGDNTYSCSVTVEKICFDKTVYTLNQGDEKTITFYCKRLSQKGIYCPDSASLSSISHYEDRVCYLSSDNSIVQFQEYSDKKPGSTLTHQISSGSEKVSMVAKKAGSCEIMACMNGAVYKATVIVKGKSGSSSVAVEEKPLTNADPYRQYGRLRVSGSKLVSSVGTPVQLRGVSTHHLPLHDYFVNKETLQYLRDYWGVNLIRLSTYTEFFGTGYCDSGKQQEIESLIDRSVRAASDLGLYVIIDWHILEDGNPLTHAGEATDFFSRVSRKYASYGNVIYEICNEPNGPTTWTDIKEYADRVIPAIRANDPNSVILVAPAKYTTDYASVLKDPLNYKNIMYTTHFYAGSHKSWNRQPVIEAMAEGLPLFFSECNITEADRFGGIDYDEGEKWFSLIDTNKMSYCVWSLSDKDEVFSFFKTGTVKKSGFTDADLTEAGKWNVKHFKKTAGIIR